MLCGKARCKKHLVQYVAESADGPRQGSSRFSYCSAAWPAQARSRRSCRATQWSPLPHPTRPEAHRRAPPRVSPDRHEKDNGRAEKVFAMPEHVIRIADQAAMLGGPSAGLLIITAAWTGCRWGELAGLQRDHVHLDHGTITIDPDVGALHESAHGLWLGPPKTPALARTITLPPFLVELLHDPWRLFRVRSCSPALSAAGCAEALSTDACSGPPSKPAPVSAHCPLRHSSRGRARAVVRSARTRCPPSGGGRARRPRG
jgi:integrase